ncbi:MAG: asparaginase [Paludibacteraceae bacterium]|nr:asparaginase [Paludibacteraceae bacterium]
MCNENKKSSVLLIFTGGTISMGENSGTGSLSPLDTERVLGFVPELKMLNVNLASVSFSPLIDSSDVEPSVWVRIAQIVEENYDKFDGFVVLHGTDTMSYSASALSFMFNNLRKPVIFTGSQLPVGVLRSDAKENLITAIELAADKDEQGNAMVPEVALFFEGQLMRGNRTTKRSAEEFDAFASFNYHLLAKAGVHVKYFPEYIHYEHSNIRMSIDTACSNEIAILKLFPGIRKENVEAVLNIPGLRGVVLETFGSGNAPRAEWFYNLLKEANDRGIVFVNVSQCRAGSVEMGRYETSLNLKRAGVVSGHDMTLEAAATKLMMVLGRTTDSAEAREMLEMPLRGEMTLFED